MFKDINSCFYARCDFCPDGLAFSGCVKCPKLKFCCAHQNNCEPWHCGVYLAYKEEMKNAK